MNEDPILEEIEMSLDIVKACKGLGDLLKVFKIDTDKYVLGQDVFVDTFDDTMYASTSTDPTNWLKVINADNVFLYVRAFEGVDIKAVLTENRERGLNGIDKKY